MGPVHFKCNLWGCRLDISSFDANNISSLVPDMLVWERLKPMTLLVVEYTQ